MNRLVRLAPVLLAVSVISRFVWAFVTPNGMNLVDLHVYVEGSAALLGDNLYDYTYSVQTPDFPLPFTYPPFAALVFFPLHYLPFTVVGIVWQAATMIALFAVVRLALSMVLGDDRAAENRWVRIAMLWTALGLWSEPVRTTLDYGQVNVFLVLLALLAVRSSRWWVAGGLVGFAAGIKLTPAITGLYFLATRRWKAAAFSAVAFALSVAVSYAVLGRQAATYFTTLLGDADRIGPVGSVWNQSLRGGSEPDRGRGRRPGTAVDRRRSDRRGSRCAGMASTRSPRLPGNPGHRPTPGLVGVADFVVAPLDLGDSDGDLAAARAVARYRRSQDRCRLLAGDGHGGGALVAELLPGIDLDHSPSRARGLGRCRRRDRIGPVPRLGRLRRTCQAGAVSASIRRARSTSFCVRPPALCVDSVNVSVRHLMSMSG